jgi:hypothetical protein
MTKKEVEHILVTIEDGFGHVLDNKPVRYTSDVFGMNAALQYAKDMKKTKKHTGRYICIYKQLGAPIKV